MLFNKVKLDKKEKEARDKCFVGLWKNENASYFSGDKAEKIAKKELNNLYKIIAVKEFKGVIANSGTVTGVVRIINSGNIESVRRVRKEFKKGEILITEMTQPNIMDIASKSAAIVTDEGGMLSHAAIISRELKIPCVVGTHFATSVLKDGDLVEVDADKGIIKILK